jgi:hypothetical protein
MLAVGFIMLFKSRNESWLFIDPIELLQLYKDAIAKLRQVKVGESLTIHENKHEDFRISVYEMPVEYEKLVKINKLLCDLLRENENDLKNIELAKGVWRSPKDGGNYCQ